MRNKFRIQAAHANARGVTFVTPARTWSVRYGHTTETRTAGADLPAHFVDRPFSEPYRPTGQGLVTLQLPKDFKL